MAPKWSSTCPMPRQRLTAWMAWLMEMLVASYCGHSDTTGAAAWIPIGVVWGQGWQLRGGTAVTAVRQWLRRHGFQSMTAAAAAVLRHDLKFLKWRLVPLRAELVLERGWVGNAVCRQVAHDMRDGIGINVAQMSKADQAHAHESAMDELNVCTPRAWVEWWLMLAAVKMVQRGEGLGLHADELVGLRMRHLVSYGVNAFYQKCLETGVTWGDSLQIDDCLLLIGPHTLLYREFGQAWVIELSWFSGCDGGGCHSSGDARSGHGNSGHGGDGCARGGFGIATAAPDARTEAAESAGDAVRGGARGEWSSGILNIGGCGGGNCDVAIIDCEDDDDRQVAVRQDAVSRWPMVLSGPRVMTIDLTGDSNVVNANGNDHGALHGGSVRGGGSGVCRLGLEDIGTCAVDVGNDTPMGPDTQAGMILYQQRRHDAMERVRAWRVDGGCEKKVRR